MRGRADAAQSKKLVTSLCIVIVFVGLLFLYNGSFFGRKGQPASGAFEYRNKISRSLGWGSDDDGEVGKIDESIFAHEGGDNNVRLKNFPVSFFLSNLFLFRNITICYVTVLCLMLLYSLKVCDDRHSELIPCLDRNLIYQMRLKLDLNLMEHYERHCPQPERRYNCLIPPPPGYKVDISYDFVFFVFNFACLSTCLI